jgi:hypothetical protein
MAFKASLDILSISPVGCSPPLSSVRKNVCELFDFRIEHHDHFLNPGVLARVSCEAMPVDGFGNWTNNRLFGKWQAVAFERDLKRPSVRDADYSSKWISSGKTSNHLKSSFRSRLQNGLTLRST